MNNKFTKVSLLIGTSLILLIAGCGPQNMNDEQNVDQTNISNKDAQSPDAPPPKRAMRQAQAPQGQDMDQGQAPQGQDMDQGQAPQGQDMDQGQAPQGQDTDQGQAPQQEGGCPAGGCPAAAANGGGGGGGCPTGDCEIPPDPDTNKAVQNPDVVKSEATKVIPTGEKQVATDTVDYHTTHHVWQPSERHHTVHKHRNLVRRHFTKVVYHPTFRRINRVVTSGSASDEVMPTEEVVAPTIDHGCSHAQEPVVQQYVQPVYVQPVWITAY